MIFTKNAKATQETNAVLGVIRMCEKYNTLPRGGGLLDQDSLFIYVLQHVALWTSQREELDRKKQQSNLPAS